jgi:nickel/cobalt exporter
MSGDLGPLCLAALTIGFFHTLYGPDHYVPFVAMARVGKWSVKKTLIVTLLCGIGHVGSSVVLGFIGIAFGIVVFQLETIEQRRGGLAGWLLVGFGLAYFVWGTVRAIRNQPHTHLHVHLDGSLHAHEHVHQGEHLHAHVPQPADASPAVVSPAVGKRRWLSPRTMTPWVLLTIFIFGPCEPLIPLLMYPAAKADTLGCVCVTALFGLATLATMTSMVMLMYAGTGVVRFQWLNRYSHALAGLVVLSCGLAIKCGL